MTRHLQHYVPAALVAGLTVASAQDGITLVSWGGVAAFVLLLVVGFIADVNW